MVTEREYSRQLNIRGFQALWRQTRAPLIAGALILIYVVHVDLHLNERRNFFKNKSKMFGGLKNPMY